MQWFASPALPPTLEPSPGTSQCNYELLRAFAGYARSRRLPYTLGAGTLLGAMRNSPPGLLQWEHDVDVYMLARHAFELVRRLRDDCAPSRLLKRSRWCRTLDFRGLVDGGGKRCCGFGLKIFHRRSAACELDILVLSAAGGPWMHGETPWWPFWGPLLSPAYASLVAAASAAWRAWPSCDFYGVRPQWSVQGGRTSPPR